MPTNSKKKPLNNLSSYNVLGFKKDPLKNSKINKKVIASN